MPKDADGYNEYFKSIQAPNSLMQVLKVISKELGASSLLKILVHAYLES